VTGGSTPAVSVLLPVYNSGRFLAEAIESILVQTFRDFEFLIIDDGSTDGSAEIARRFAGLDPRIRLVARANRGLVATLIELTGLARGGLLARMDADDIALPRRFERQVAYLREHPEVVVAGSWVEWIDQEGDSLREFHVDEGHEAIDRLHMEEGTNSICHPAAMIRADAIRKVGGYRVEYTEAAEDYDLWLRLAEVGRVANMPEILLKYRFRTTSYARSRDFENAKLEDQAIREACKRRGWPARTPERALVDRRLTEADHRMTWAWWALGGGNLKSARKNALLRLRKKPLSVESWKLLRSVIRGR
jgi:glycosyltransferase involved in cell wall biosynthesis